MKSLSFQRINAVSSNGSEKAYEKPTKHRCLVTVPICFKNSMVISEKEENRSYNISYGIGGAGASAGSKGPSPQRDERGDGDGGQAAEERHRRR